METIFSGKPRSEEGGRKPSLVLWGSLVRGGEIGAWVSFPGSPHLSSGGGNLGPALKTLPLGMAIEASGKEPKPSRVRGSDLGLQELSGGGGVRSKPGGQLPSERAPGVGP